MSDTMNIDAEGDYARHILVLCTGNSARSVTAEALFQRYSPKNWLISSAGSKPSGKVNPTAIEMLKDKGYDTSGFYSKSWDIFAVNGGEITTPVDLVITVCDNAAGEACPLWPGAPVRMHWGVADPAHIEPEEKRRQAFEEVYAAFEPKIQEAIALLTNTDDWQSIKNDLLAMAPELENFS